MKNISGILFVAIFAFIAMQISKLSFIAPLGISPLVIGIIMGILYANTLHNKLPERFHDGILFCASKLLRFAIILYGFRITFQQIYQIGFEGLFVSFFMLATTLIIGTLIGIKIFKLDKEIAILTAAGSAICGAAAVIAFEAVLKSEPYKGIAAIATVVLFGTISMFLYPALYHAGLFNLDSQSMGIFIGGSVHEVAQVVAASSAISQETANNAVIVKMTRVIMLAPLLLATSYYISKYNNKISANKPKIIIPWFAILFIGVAGFNSLHLLPEQAVNQINIIDGFLLTMAMVSLGIGTRISKLKGVGIKPFYLAGMLFIWLMAAGYMATYLVT